MKNLQDFTFKKCCTMLTAFLRYDRFVEGQELTEEKFENCLIDSMHWFGDCYPNAGYGAKFYKWLFDETVTGSYNRINASKFMEYCYN